MRPVSESAIPQGATVRRLPVLPSLVAQVRDELRAALADINCAEPLPRSSRYVRDGNLNGAHWDTEVTICPQHYAKPVTVICLDERSPSHDLIALQGVDCAFPTDIKTITAQDARRLGNALLAAANAAEGRLT